MVILTLPRALECCERIQEVLDHSPEIQDMVKKNPVESVKISLKIVFLLWTLRPTRRSGRR